MTPADDPPPDPADADLIAYLDGELDEPAARAVEARMARDPDARDAAEAYRKTFDLLDYLPKPEPSADFASRTLTRLQAASASASGPAAAPPRRRWREAAAWVAAAVVAVVGGYAAHAVAHGTPPTRSPDPLALSDLRVIEHLPLYVGADDLDFVRRLDAPELFAPPDDATDPPATAARPDPPAGNRDRLIELFSSYPPARQEQLRRLDRQLTELPAAERARLFGVLERYAIWLDRLPDPDRRDVLAAETPEERLELVRVKRERAWRESLPGPAREQLKLVADPEERLRLVVAWKRAARARHDEWALARRQWDAVRRTPDEPLWPFGDPALAAGVDDFLRAVLRVDPAQKLDPKLDLPQSCRLTREEFAELKLRQEAAHKEGYWLLYGACVLKLADRHPGLPEPANRPAIVDFQHLSADTLKDLKFKKISQEVRRQHLRGKWPDFALELAQAAQRVGTPVPEPLGPAKPDDYSPTIRKFIRDTLDPVLRADERAGWAKIEGKWPDHPRQLMELARKHDLSVPGLTLPGRPSLWARYYAGGPAGD